jgi:hypothetical protein
MAIKQEKEKKQTFEEKIYPLIYDNAPNSLKSVQNTWLLLSIGVFAQAAWLFFFIFTTLQSYNSKMSSPFLSLEADAGVCTSVTITNSGVAHIDVNGYWDTALEYDSTEPAYTVWFSEFEADTSTWAADMENLADAVNTELTFLKSISDLPTKILHLSSWRKTIQAGKKGEFTVLFNADPGWIFDMTSMNLESIIGKESDNCDSQDSWSYENGKFSLGFPYWDGKGDPTVQTPGDFDYNGGTACPTFNPDVLGFNWDYPTEQFNLIFDVRTSITIAALNASIISQDDLVYTTHSYYDMTSDVKIWARNMSVMYDPKFPGMDPVYFYQGVPAQRIGDTPMQVQFQGYYYEPEGGNTCPAQCSTDDLFCSIPDLFLKYSPFGNEKWSAFLSSDENQFTVNAYSSEIMRVNEAQWDPGFIGCASNTKGSYKYNSETKTGKLGNMEPELGAAGFLANLKGTKPFKIEESYLTCFPTVFTALLDSIGVAQGNAGLYTGLLVSAIALLLGFAPKAWGWLKPGAEKSAEDLTSLHLALICDPDALQGNFEAQRVAILENLANALVPALVPALANAKDAKLNPLN